MINKSTNSENFIYILMFCLTSRGMILNLGRKKVIQIIVQWLIKTLFSYLLARFSLTHQRFSLQEKHDNFTGLKCYATSFL